MIADVSVVRWHLKAACSMNDELAEPNRTTLKLKIVKSLSRLSNSDNQGSECTCDPHLLVVHGERPSQFL